MKKKLLVLVTALIMTVSVSFAQGVIPVPEVITKGLYKDFKDARDLQWKKTENFYKASFTIDQHPFEAFYSFEGERIGISRNLLVDQLPMRLIKEVKEKTSTYIVSELFELLTDRGTEYFITFKNDKETKNYKSNGDGWMRY